MISEFIQVDLYFDDRVNHKRFRLSDIVSYGVTKCDDSQYIYYLRLKATEYNSGKLRGDDHEAIMWKKVIDYIDSILL